MSVRDTTKLNRRDLKYLLLDSLKMYSENVTYEEGINPYEVSINGTSYFILIKNVHESGQHRTNEDECRLQLSRSQQIAQLLNIGQLIITLGYFADENVFTAWDPYLLTGRFNQRDNVSLYSRFSVQRSAAITGIDQYIDENGQSVLSFRPEYLGLYLENVAIFHQMNLSDLRELIGASDRLQDQSAQSVVQINRQKYTVTHTRYKRDTAFRSLVKDAYNHTCAMCGIQLSVVEAAHIVPHSHASGTDLIGNGLCLCPLHHKSYDSSLVYVLGDYSIRINEAKVDFLQKTGKAGGIDKLTALNRNKLLLPTDRLHLPFKQNIILANRIRGIS